jgi:hypothetical protein
MASAAQPAPPAMPLPAGVAAALARQQAGLGRFRWVVPEGQRPGPLLRECLALAGRGAAPTDPARPPVLAPMARLPALETEAAARALLAAPEEVLAALRAGRGLVMIDSSHEGRALHPPHVANLHAALAAAGLPPGRVAWVQQNRLLGPHYAAACAATGAAPVNIVVAHAHAAGLVRRAMPGGTGTNWRFGFAVAHDGPRPHRWVCLNYNLRAHRALLAAWLRERPEPGFLSFSVTRRTHLRPARADLLEGAAALDRADPRGARAAVARLLDAGVHQGSDIDGFANPNERVYSLPAAEVAGAELFIVTETEMAGPGLLRWTEKTLKALGSGLPFVVFGNAGVVAALEALGFDVLRDLVDHGYDARRDHAARFVAARAAVARFLARPPGFTAAELARLRAAAAHNAAVFTDAVLRDALVAPMDEILALAAG